MPIVDDEIVLRIRVVNTFLTEERDLDVIFDTGYDGFLLLPTELFDRIRFREIYNEQKEAITATGEHVLMTCTYGTVEYPQLGHSVDGLVCTSPRVDAILIGMQAISGLEIIVNNCDGSTNLRLC
ncbi:MAG: hypothetical protein ACE5R6_05415 [Candidatus Heimdallarchaeota archaeon]